MTFYLHVGASKTASTTLQGRFFPAHPDIFFLGKEESTITLVKRWATPEIFKIVNDIDRRNLDFRLDDDTVKTALDYIRQSNNGRPIVYSFEDLCEFTGPSSFEKLARFQNVFNEFGPIRIIIGVRSQLELLKSLYITLHRAEMFRIYGGKVNWYPTFDQYIEVNFKYCYAAVLESFRFCVLLDHYSSVLGPENVFVFAFEDFKKDAAGVLRKLCRFMEIDENSACVEETANTRENQHQSGRKYTYLKLRWALLRGLSINKLIPSGVRSKFWNWLDAGPKVDFTASEAVTQRIMEYYQADNEALARKYGIRL